MEKGPEAPLWHPLSGGGLSWQHVMNQCLCLGLDDGWEAPYPALAHLGCPRPLEIEMVLFNAFIKCLEFCWQTEQ